MAFSVHTGPHVQPRDCRIRNPVSERYRAGLRRPRGAVGRTLRRGRPARSHQSDAPQYLGARCATADDVHCQGARRNGRSHLLWTKHPGPIAHSAMMLFARITSPQRRASSLMKAAVSAGVLPSGSTLSVRKRCCTSGILSTSMVALAI